MTDPVHNLRADLLTGHLFDLRFQRALFGVTQFAGTGNLRFGESQPRVELFLQLLDDP